MGKQNGMFHMMGVGSARGQEQKRTKGLCREVFWLSIRNLTAHTTLCFCPLLIVASVQLCCQCTWRTWLTFDCDVWRGLLLCEAIQYLNWTSGCTNCPSQPAAWDPLNRWWQRRDMCKVCDVPLHCKAICLKKVLLPKHEDLHRALALVSRTACVLQSQLCWKLGILYSFQNGQVSLLPQERRENPNGFIKEPASNWIVVVIFTRLTDHNCERERTHSHCLPCMSIQVLSSSIG